MKKGKHVEEEDKDEEPEKKDEEEDEEEPTKKMVTPTLSTQAWRDAIAGLQADHGTLTMAKEDYNLTSWQKAQEAVRNQKQ